MAGRLGRLGLRSRLVAVLVVAAASLLAITTVVVARSEAAVMEVERARFAALTHQLAKSAGYAVLARSGALLEPSLNAFAASPDLVWVGVYDDGGGLVAATGEEAGRAGSPELLIEVEEAVSTEGSLPGDDEGELGAFGIDTHEPRVVGCVKAVFSSRASKGILRRLRWGQYRVVALGSGVGILVVYLLASSIVKRTLAVTRAASRVAGGDLAVRLDDTGSDELAVLASDFNRMTESLEAQRKALGEAGAKLAERESLAAIGRATAVIAHELKNPLGILLCAAEIVAKGDRPEAARRKAGSIIEEEVRRLSHTLSSLLDYARPRPPSRNQVDALALCQEAGSRASSPGGPAEAIAVSVEGESAVVSVDRGQMEQVLLNLIANAAQAGARRVRISIRRDEERALIVVDDDGSGIDPKIRDLLFRPFVTTKQRGAGLGLAASRRMARDNDGDLRLEQGEGETGACFVLELPI
ncbi:MAG: ATP-binding protein [Pseudomonadota bacterium]